MNIMKFVENFVQIVQIVQIFKQIGKNGSKSINKLLNLSKIHLKLSRFSTKKFLNIVGTMQKS